MSAPASDPLTPNNLPTRLREYLETPIPSLARGETPARHRRLFAAGREDLSLAKLAEAHWDALSILAEANHPADPTAIYAVWASERPGDAVQLDRVTNTLSGTKPFCSGAPLVDRALLTASAPREESVPEALLVDLDLRPNRDRVRFDGSAWATPAFAQTATGAVSFQAALLAPGSIVGPPGFYLSRPGFWHGACGPAACWAGGVAGLLDAALLSSRRDPHTLAHLAAMHAAVWSLLAMLDAAGREIDAAPGDRASAHIRALALRHLVEQTSTDVLRRFARALGPHPLAMDATISRRYLEADLFLRQSHAERDLEALGRALLETSSSF